MAKEIITKIYDKYEDIEQLRSVWTHMQNPNAVFGLNADIDRYIADLEPIKETSRPFIVAAYRDSQPAALLLGRIGPTKILCRIGHITLFKASMTSIRIDHEAMLGNFDPEICSVFVEILYDTLRKGMADVTIFNFLAVDSDIYHVLRSKFSYITRGNFPKTHVHWRMTIPESMDDFYSKLSKKHRGNLKRQIKHLERDHEVKFITYSKPDVLHKGFEDALEVSKKTYQYAMGPGSALTEDPKFVSMLKSSSIHGWLRLHILYIDGQPCAFQLGIKYNKTYRLEKIGFDPEWKKLGIGSSLYLKVLDTLCSDPETQYMDFGFGDSDYKRSYGDESWKEATVYYFAPRFYPVLVNHFHSFISAARLSIRYIADKAGVQKKLKRWWKKELTKKL